MALGILAYTLFSVHDAPVKAAILALPVVQVLFVRSLVRCLEALAAAAHDVRPRAFGTRHIVRMPLHDFRLLQPGKGMVGVCRPKPRHVIWAALALTETRL